MKPRFIRTAGVGTLAAATALAVSVTGAPGTPGGTVAASASNAAYSLSEQTYPDGRKVVARWNPCQKAITYKVNPTKAAKKKKGRRAAVRDTKGAFARLSQATGISFKFRGRTKQVPKNTSKKNWADRQKKQNAEIVVAWVDQKAKKKKYRTNLLGTSGNGWAAGTGGYSYKFWRVGDEPWHGVTGRGFAVLDAGQNKKFRKGFGRGATRGDLLLHELGHVMGLNHVGTTAELMFPTIIRRGTSGYRPGDRAGLHMLGRTQGCIEVPDWIWKGM